LPRREQDKRALLVSLLVSLLISAVLTAVLWLIPGVGGCAVVGILPGIASFWGLTGLHRKRRDGKKRASSDL